MNQYAELCGWALASAHARSGDAAKIAAIGKKEDFDEALADFSESYADQNEKDYRAMVASGAAGALGSLSRALRVSASLTDIR